MTFKTFIGAIFFGLIFFANVSEAYDLPKIEVEKQGEEEVDQKKIFKSDWTEWDEWKEKISELEKNKNFPADDEKRILRDKNLVYVATYKGFMFYLDRYSIEIQKNSEAEQSWRQKIFTIGKDISSKTARAITQTFYTDGDGKYNSSKRKNNLDEIENDEDKEFLEECYKVGYHYAFIAEK